MYRGLRESVAFGKHSPKYLGSTLWNIIRTDLRNHLSLDAFKRAVRKLDFHQFISICMQKYFAVLFVTLIFMHC